MIHPRITLISVGVALASGVGLTLMGLHNLNFYILLDCLIFLAGSLVLIWCSSWFMSKSPFLIAGVLAVLLVLASRSLWPLFVVLWFVLSAVLLGRWLLRAVGAKGCHGIAYFLVGAGVYGFIVGLLAHWPINYPIPYAVILALPLVLGRRILLRGATLGKRRLKRSRQANWLDAAIAAVLLLHFVVALMPELGFDALWMHLFVPSQMANRHKWGFDVTTYVWAVTPMLGDWIFSIGYLIGGETASRLINTSFILVLVWQTRELALWMGSSQYGARWTMLIFLTTPLTFAVSTTMFIEPIWAGFVLVGTFAILKACFASRRSNTNLKLAGILLGCALAAKAVTFTILPTLFIIFIFRYRTWLQRRWVPASIISMVAFLTFGAVPYTRAWLITGNPVFPFFNGIFHSPFWHQQNFTQPAFGTGVTWDLLYQVTFHTEKYAEAIAGAAGFQWLLLLLPTVALVFASRQWRGAIVLFVGVVSIVLAFRSTAYIRYVFPAAGMLIAVLGLLMTFGEKKGGFVKHGLTLVAACVVFLNLWFLNATSFYYDFPWQTLLSEDHRREYLTQQLPLRNAVEFVNGINVDRSPVAVIGESRAAGLLADPLYDNWTNFTFEPAILAVKTEADAKQLFNERNVTYAILNTTSPQANHPYVTMIKKVCEPVTVIGTMIVLKLKK